MVTLVCFVTAVIPLTGVLRELKLRFMSLVEVTVGLNALVVDFPSLGDLEEGAAALKLRFMLLVDMTEGLKGCAAFFLPWYRKYTEASVRWIGHQEECLLLQNMYT